MKRLVLVALLLLLVSSAVSAQTATPNSKFNWSQLAQAAAVANSATYPLYLDNATTSTQSLTGVGCGPNATTPANADCASAVPALTAGQHTAAITQMIAGAESGKSNSAAFQFVIVVNPTALKIARLLSFAHGGVLTSRGRVWARQQVRDLQRLASD